MSVTTQRGFTLLEMSFVLFVAALLLQGYFLIKQDLVEERIVQETINGFGLIDEAVLAFRADNDAWPADMGGLSLYLPGFSNANGAGLPYSLQLPDTGTGLIIASDLQTEAQQLQVADAFPTNGVVVPDSTTVQIGIPLPGYEAIHNELLHIEAGSARPLQGDLHLGNNSINDVNVVNASYLNATVRVSSRELRLTQAQIAGSSCNTGRIVRDVHGNLLICDDNKRRLASGSAIFSGTADREDRVYPPSGYSMSDCSLTTQNRPTLAGIFVHHSNSGSYALRKTSYFELKFETHWKARSHSGHYYENVNEPIYWQMVCTKNAAGVNAPTVVHR